MNHLFIARHGIYDKISYRLGQEGKKQMGVLGISIRGILHGGSAQIISSTAPRALDSSGVLVAQLGLTGFEQVPYLWTGRDSNVHPNYDNDGNRKSHEVLMAMIEERKAKADWLVIMTHLEVAEDFSRIFHRLILGEDKSYRDRVEKGQAVYFDLEHKTVRVLPVN